MNDQTSSYECNCGNVFDLYLAKETEFSIMYKAECPVCHARIFEWRAARHDKSQESNKPK